MTEQVSDLAQLLREAVRPPTPTRTHSAHAGTTRRTRRRRKRASKMSKSSGSNRPPKMITDTSSPAPASDTDTLRTTKTRRVLTDQEVTDIRVAYLVDRLPVAKICETFGLPQSTVYTCARGTSYKHVPMPEGASNPDDNTPQRRTKVSAVAVAGIRADAEAKNADGTPAFTQAEIARKYGVSPPYVRAVVLGKFRVNG